jgi:hypothetical protein
VDVPSEIPFNIGIGVILAKSNLVGERELDEKLKPFRAQYDLGPGDTAILSTAESLIDKDFTAVKVLTPEDHAAEFPDWEERLQNSYVLCRWNSEQDPEGDIGWFARVKLIQVAEEHYNLTQLWVAEKNFPESPPAWLAEYHNAYADNLNEVSPGAVPVTPTCPECGSRDVQIHAMHIHRMAGQVGEVVKDGQTKYIVRHDPTTDSTTEAHLHCMGCNARGDLDDDDWDFEFH